MAGNVAAPVDSRQAPQKPTSVCWRNSDYERGGRNFTADGRPRPARTLRTPGGSLRKEIVGGLEETAAEEAIEALEPAQGLAADERDRVRRNDLETLRQALERYAVEAGSYPDTGGQVQSLCGFQELDAGCALAADLPELPSDPLGSSADNGYWYASDGTSFVLIAQQEETTREQTLCPEEVVRFLAGEAHYCVQGPTP